MRRCTEEMKEKARALLEEQLAARAELHEFVHEQLDELAAGARPALAKEIGLLKTRLQNWERIWADLKGQ
jgi:hypothetical protein